MPSVHDTAYPRLKSNLSTEELTRIYTPTADELALAKSLTKGISAKICFLVLLKTFQRLGYFQLLHKVPPQIAEHISLIFSVHYGAMDWQAYDESGTRRRHVAMIGEYLGVHPYDESAQKLVVETIRQAAHIKEDSADIINITIEELVRHGYELPGFTTLLNETKRGKAEVNRRFYTSVCDARGAERCQQIDHLLDADLPNKRSLWQTIKTDGGAADAHSFAKAGLALRLAEIA